MPRCATTSLHSAGTPSAEATPRPGISTRRSTTSSGTGPTPTSSKRAMPMTRWATRASSVPVSVRCRPTRTSAYIQTIKEARVSPGDPFDNNQPHFYRGSMLARHAANAVFPCGSGLVWRRQALADIGGFPTWNLVEDLQSGIEALRRGWRGVYLPILGAVAQHAPEDIPVTYKQRGTWAVDTMRLVFWGGLRGLRLRQRLQFLELGLFYLQSFAMLAFMAAPIIGFAFVVYPVEASAGLYSLHFWPFAAALELFLRR